MRICEGLGQSGKEDNWLQGKMYTDLEVRQLESGV